MYSGGIARHADLTPSGRPGAQLQTSRPAGHTSPPAEVGWLVNLDCYTCLCMLYMVAAHSYVRQLGIGSCQWMHALFSSWADVRETRCHASPAIRSALLLPEPQFCSLEKKCYCSCSSCWCSCSSCWCSCISCWCSCSSCWCSCSSCWCDCSSCWCSCITFHAIKSCNIYDEVCPQLQRVLQRLKKADELSSVDVPAKPSKKSKRDEDEASTSHQADAL